MLLIYPHPVIVITSNYLFLLIYTQMNANKKISANTTENVTSKMARKHAIAKEPAMKESLVKPILMNVVSRLVQMKPIVQSGFDETLYFMVLVRHAFYTKNMFVSAQCFC